MTQLMDGKTIDYTYAGGLRFIVTFSDGAASYRAVGETGGVSGQNDNIPYRSQQIRPGLIHTVWHEEEIGDIVSLVIDLDASKVYSAALLGYPADDRMLHFEDGVIASIIKCSQNAYRKSPGPFISECQQHRPFKGGGKSAHRRCCAACPMHHIALRDAPGRVNRFSAIKCFHLNQTRSSSFHNPSEPCHARNHRTSCFGRDREAVDPGGSQKLGVFEPTNSADRLSAGFRRPFLFQPLFPE